MRDTLIAGGNSLEMAFKVEVKSIGKLGRAQTLAYAKLPIMTARVAAKAAATAVPGPTLRMLPAPGTDVDVDVGLPFVVAEVPCPTMPVATVAGVVAGVVVGDA